MDLLASVSTNKGPSQDQETKNLGEIIRICQLNAEGLSRAKSEYISKLLLDQNIDMAIIQETHLEDENQQHSRGRIYGYDLLGATYHRSYGTATYIRSTIDNAKLLHTATDLNIHQVVTKVADVTVVNIYKPPNISWPDSILDTYPHPTVYAGDFNSHHNTWKYRATDENGERLADWADSHSLSLIFDAKDRATFRSAAWNTETNPDLCFVSENAQNRPIPITRKVLEDFPHSQHRPVILEIGIKIPIIRSTPRPRWNFGKAQWDKYAARLDETIRWIPPKSSSYSRFTKAIIATAKKCIPRGFRKEYIPGWNDDMEHLHQQFQNSGDSEIADELLNRLNIERRKKWEETTSALDFRRSSRRAWSLLKKLGSSNPPARKTPEVSADQIAARVVKLSKAPGNKQQKTVVKKRLKTQRQATAAHPIYSRPFTVDDVNTALEDTKSGKAPGFDGIHPEFLKNCGKHTRVWLSKFYSDLLLTGNIPIKLKKSKIIAVLKPNKPGNLPESYRPIALLSSCYKLLERMLLNRLGPQILEHTPIEQAGFRPHRSCVDQVLSLTTHIEAGFQKRLKSTVVFVDLTAAYDTVWREGLLYKFLNIIPCSRITSLLNNMLCDRPFQIITGDSKSKTRHLNNGLPQGSVLAPLLFNLYISDMPPTVSKKFGYADDLALAARSNTIEDNNNTLSEDLSNLSKYFADWRLIPSMSKTEVSCFHLNNKQARMEPQVYFNDNLLRYNPHPKYLGVTLDRTLSFKKHLENTAAKINTRNNIIHKLCGTTWGANASTLRTSSLSLVYSVAEYCAPVWLSSCHVKTIDTKLNQTMRIISGSLKSTPLPWLHVLSHIAPPHIRRQESLIREFNKIMANDLLPVHDDVLDAGMQRLKSRSPPLVLGERLHQKNFSVETEWREYWETSGPVSPAHDFDPTESLPGMELPRRGWRALNRIRTSHGICRDSLHKWGMVESPACDCGEPRQTVHHIVFDCPLTAYEGEASDFLEATDSALDWINGLNFNI